MAIGSSTYGPTTTHKAELNRAIKQLKQIKAILKNLTTMKLPDIEKQLKAINAPWIEGQGLIDD